MKRFLFFAVVATLFAACSKDAISEEQGIQNIVDEAPAMLTVGFEDDETRIQLNEAQKTVWTNGDLVSVFYRSDANQQWQYTGETGARTADLTRVDAGEATTKTARVVVVYPYNEDYYFNTETYNVQASLPATQTYLKDSYGLDGNIMISQSEYNNISLKNVCGWLKLQLTGNGEQVKSITVRGNNGEQVAGELYINSADATATLASEAGDAGEDEGENETGSAGGNLVFEDTVLKEVTLNCLDRTSPIEKGVALGAEATAFYIALPPQTFAKGLTVEVEATDGHIMAKSTDKAITIERNHIQPMTAIEFFPTYPIGNEIFYTATEKITPHNLDYIDATFISSSWDAETGFGVMLFDGDITKLGREAFSWRSALTSVIIPEGVTTLDTGAFFQCVNMSSVHLPSTLTTIGYEAFCNCTSLTDIIILDGVVSIGERAFADCRNLMNVTFGSKLETIYRQAFAGCNSLSDINLPDSVVSIGNCAFQNCKHVTTVTIPNNVEKIEEGAFYGCTLLSEFKGKYATNDGRSLIVNDTFIAYAIGCDAIEYVIPHNVTKVGNYAFDSSAYLVCITIPESVTEIRHCSFASCEKLTTIWCKPIYPPKGTDLMFYGNVSDRKIYVPTDSVEAYKTAEGWSDYADYIFEEE